MKAVWVSQDHSLWLQPASGYQSLLSPALPPQPHEHKQQSLAFCYSLPSISSVLFSMVTSAWDSLPCRVEFYPFFKVIIPMKPALNPGPQHTQKAPTPLPLWLCLHFIEQPFHNTHPNHKHVAGNGCIFICLPQTLSSVTHTLIAAGNTCAKLIMGLSKSCK